jgi:hypothetical protein
LIIILLYISIVTMADVNMGEANGAAATAVEDKVEAVPEERTAQQGKLQPIDPHH